MSLSIAYDFPLRGAELERVVEEIGTVERSLDSCWERRWEAEVRLTERVRADSRIDLIEEEDTIVIE